MDPDNHKQLFIVTEENKTSPKFCFFTGRVMDGQIDGRKDKTKTICFADVNQAGYENTNDIQVIFFMLFYPKHTFYKYTLSRIYISITNMYNRRISILIDGNLSRVVCNIYKIR